MRRRRKQNQNTFSDRKHQKVVCYKHTEDTNDVDRAKSCNQEVLFELQQS